ncbi:hypothetical protein Lokhon_01500 [Limimaricola hongkongensis DSM 17492]|uniref:Uncharacterized protein n=1 Tax=Limimaricola hongkongensis DSM 17492 TaxID=1122180 RepID=A0A017HFY4_9RHOB|nr:hypothetical protein Lokhon_01500 [Limimaricola hongkongensis DSM 17492]
MCHRCGSDPVNVPAHLAFARARNNIADARRACARGGVSGRGGERRRRRGSP